MKLDPITTEVINSRIRETTAAMAHALFHSGYSPILRESQDGTAGLCDAEGRVIMVGGGLQYHSLLYTRAVESVVERYPVADMRDGESFISNDPFKAGNSHVPDIVVITPVVDTRRTTCEACCEMYRLPAASIATADGAPTTADDAEPPSPDAPCVPLPQHVEVFVQHQVRVGRELRACSAQVDRVTPRRGHRPVPAREARVLHDHHARNGVQQDAFIFSHHV